jgi:hypothetical protein
VDKRAVIVVRTANRPEVLQRCLGAAVEGCDVAKAAQWLVLDDSSPENSARTREVGQHWSASGLRLAYADRGLTEQIAKALPTPKLRDAFVRFVAKSPSSPGATGRNFGLLAGLSLSPAVVYFLDDDMVHRHQENCFFHWCVNIPRTDSFVAAPRKLGILDMTYLDRLALIFELDEWARFISDSGISADAQWWNSSKNPFWKEKHDEDAAREDTVEREVINGGIMALRDYGSPWFPFPNGYNEDLNWSLLQAAHFGTPLLKVGGVNVHHLPPSLPLPDAEAILAELVGGAITRALREVKPCGDPSFQVLAAKLPEVFQSELKQSLFLLVDVELALRSAGRNCGSAVHATLSKIQSTLTAVAERLKSVDSRQLATEWLSDFALRRDMFLELRHSEAVQEAIHGELFREYGQDGEEVQSPVR